MISICVPSRGRPKRIRTLLNSIKETAITDNIEVLFFLDTDDLSTIEKTIFDEYTDLHLKFFRGKSVISGTRYNTLLSLASGDIIMYASDDTVFTKKNWDTDVKDIFDSLEDKIALLFSPDIIHKSEIPTSGFVSRRSTEILGYLFYPVFRCWYNDCWLAELYKSVGRYMVYDLGIVHQHFSQGYGEYDSTYAQQYSVVDGETQVDLDTRIFDEHKRFIPEHAELLRTHLCQN